MVRSIAARLALRFAVCCAVVTLLLGAGMSPTAVAAEAVPTADGADVGYPQCDTALPPVPAFVVVAVNDGVATVTNRCLAQQLAWAAGASGGAGTPKLDLYVNTANPGPLLASWWPAADRTRRGVAVRPPAGRCTGDASTACAYVYGVSLALDDLQTRGVAVPAGTRWWLDVETANTWSPSTARNRAVLEGMTRTLTAAGYRTGLYALSSEFRDLIGSVPAGSPLATLPSWLAGSGDVAAAAKRCTAAALAGGRTLLAQVPGSATAVDRDLVCRPFASAPKPRITGGREVGDRLTATAGTWRPAAHLAYRWLRDGAPIGGATGATHRVVRADAGHRLTVAVTATLDGYSRTVATAKAVRARR